jgi:NAD(P)-dependent dehydrogenase (short-subunit alcohol dehydrogenase family)
MQTHLTTCNAKESGERQSKSGGAHMPIAYLDGPEGKRPEGKVAVVTGGNSGIGLATAKHLQQEGAWVAISGRSEKTLDEAVKTIGNGVLAIQADVAKLAELDRLFAEVSSELGKIDVLLVNAGVAKFAPWRSAPTTSNLTSISRERISPFRRRCLSSMMGHRSF